jgi:hypothetical protein
LPEIYPRKEENPQKSPSGGCCDRVTCTRPDSSSRGLVPSFFFFLLANYDVSACFHPGTSLAYQPNIRRCSGLHQQGPAHNGFH